MDEKGMNGDSDFRETEFRFHPPPSWLRPETSQRVTRVEAKKSEKNFFHSPLSASVLVSQFSLFFLFVNPK